MLRVLQTWPAKILAMGAMFFLAALFLKVWFDRKLSGWEYAVGMLSLVAFWNLKYYYVAVFMPVALTSHLLVIEWESTFTV
jgi:hypothetical protein